MSLVTSAATRFRAIKNGRQFLNQNSLAPGRTCSGRQRLACYDGARLTVRKNETNSFGRIFRIKRHISSTGFQDAEHSHIYLSRTRQKQSDAVAVPDALA